MRRNKKQEYAILWLHAQNKKMGDIAEELNISVDKVDAAIRANKSPEESKQAKKASKSKDLMISETSSKGTKNVSIMTGEASALNDNLRKKYVGKNKDTQDHIFRPNDSE
tara:strand:- start:12414 stop:12743 length:330 start_codon:yes stop_codon:yes gene_type:complete